MAWETVVHHSLITVGIHIADRLRRVRFLRCRLIQPNVDIRIAFSALLRIGRGGRYVLVRNLHRPEIFAPLGGVYKALEPGKQILDDLEFRLDGDVGPIQDVENDLRGFLPRRNLARLCKWFLDSDGRETAGTCLYRELREELEQVGLQGAAFKPPPAMSLRRVRVVEEGPEHVPGHPYTQYRVFEVYEPIISGAPIERFVNKLFDQAQEHPQLLLADADEILKGRTADNRLVGHHSVYLISRNRVRAEDPPFARGVAKGGSARHI
jgi:hypothetical protein